MSPRQKPLRVARVGVNEPSSLHHGCKANFGMESQKLEELGGGGRMDRTWSRPKNFGHVPAQKQ